MVALVRRRVQQVPAVAGLYRALSPPSSRRSRWAYLRRFATKDAGGFVSQIASVRDAWLMVRPGFRTSITNSVREREAEIVIVVLGALTTTEPKSPYVHVIARLPV